MYCIKGKLKNCKKKLKKKFTQRCLQAIKLDKHKKINKQTLHYFLKLSVTAELERADFNNWNSSVPLFISWIYKQKVERSKTIATGKKKDNETKGR